VSDCLGVVAGGDINLAFVNKSYNITKSTISYSDENATKQLLIKYGATPQSKNI
jgi:hypothetical protein